MKPKLSDLAEKLFRTVSPVREIMSFANPDKIKSFGLKPEEIISFGGGWVNHISPSELQKAYIDIITDETKFHKSGGYSPTSGFESTKEAILKMEKNLHNVDDLQTKNIIIGQSSSQLTYSIFQTILDQNDKICLLDPSYCNYPLQIYTASKAKIVRFSVIDEDFKYIANKKETIVKFRNFLLTEKPKVVLLVSPDNPTGKILSDSFFNAAHEAVKEYGGLIIMDFAYKEITFPHETPRYFSKCPDDNFLSIHSNSKWGRNLGRRMGWIEGSEKIVKSLESLLNTEILCPDTLHQQAFEDFINETKNGELSLYIKNTKELYKKTAKSTCLLIEKNVNLPYIKPDGGLYCIIKVSRNGAEFVGDLLKAKGVLVIPGWGFGKSLSESVRISYGPLVNSHDKIEDGIKKMGEFINETSNN